MTDTTLTQDAFVALAVREFATKRIITALEKEGTDIAQLKWKNKPKKLVAKFPPSQRILLVLSQVAIQHGLTFEGYPHHVGASEARFTVYLPQ